MWNKKNFLEATFKALLCILQNNRKPFPLVSFICLFWSSVWSILLLNSEKLALLSENRNMQPSIPNLDIKANTSGYNLIWVCRSYWTVLHKRKWLNNSAKMASTIPNDVQLWRKGSKCQTLTFFTNLVHSQVFVHVCVRQKGLLNFCGFFCVLTLMWTRIV